MTGVAPDTVAARPTLLLIDREKGNPYLRWLLHVVAPIVLSVLAHALILVALCFKQFDIAGAHGVPIGEYEAGLVDSLGPEMAHAFDWTSVDPLAELNASMPQDETFEPLAPLDVPSDNLGDLGLTEGSGGPGAGGDELGLGLGEGALSLLGTGAGAAQAGGGGLGGGGLGGGDRLGLAGMWGLQFPSSKIVYVVDFSGSVIPVVDPLKRELKRSVGQLKPTQSFDVIIFYSSGGGVDEKINTESFRPQLEAATEANRRAFFKWIDGKAPRGQTAPVEAIRRAVAMAPDVIVFHSDGMFDDALVAQINEANKGKRVKIYCMVFDDLLLADNSGLPPRSSEGALRMRQIAEANRGQVKVVMARDLGGGARP